MIIRNHLLKPILVFSLALFSQFTYATDWGAEPVDASHRPDTTWVNNFTNGTTVSAEFTDIQTAISECPATGYCTVNVPSRVAIYPSFFLNRSKTRILGTGNIKPKIDYSGNNGSFSYIWIENTSATTALEEIVIEGLELVGHDFGTDTYLGITVNGQNIHDIMIKNNTATGLHVDGRVFKPNANEDYGDGHIIYIRGTGTEDSVNQNLSISEITIDGNTITNTRTADSENITLAGNVKNWQVINNYFDNNDNIVIDAIGGEGQSSNYLLDAARYGFIENNEVFNFHYIDNSGPAAPIYVDGGQYIHIENNLVDTARTGFAIGAENCVVAKHITFKNNTTRNILYTDFSHGDIYIGGFYNDGSFQNGGYNKADPSLTPECANDNIDGKGYVEYITIDNNTIDKVQTGIRLTHAIIQSVEGVTEQNTANPNASGNENSIIFPESLSIPKPTGITPANGETVSNPVTFTWTAVSGATEYMVSHEHTDETNYVEEPYISAATANCAGGGTCSYTVNNLSVAHRNWWVRGRNSVGESAHSDGHHFIVSGGSLPLQATGISPINGETTDNPVTFTWNAVSNASWYYLWVNDTSGNKINQWYTAADAGCSAGTGTCSVTSSTALTQGAGEWWVRTWNTTGYGPWSASMNFALGASTLPIATTLISPNGTITDSTPTYTWNAVANSSWYFLWVNDSTGNKVSKWYSAAQAGCSAGTGTCSVTPSTGLAQGAAQWWVRTWNSSGYGPWSNRQDFNL